MKALQMLMVTMVAAAVLAFVVPQRFATPASAGGAPTKEYAVVACRGDSVVVDCGRGQSITDSSLGRSEIAQAMRHAAESGWRVHSVVASAVNSYIIVVER